MQKLFILEDHYKPRKYIHMKPKISGTQSEKVTEEAKNQDTYYNFKPWSSNEITNTVVSSRISEHGLTKLLLQQRPLISCPSHIMPYK